MGLDRTFVPSFGRLVRSSGMTLDRAREALVEAGYLQDAGAISGGNPESFINDLLEALDDESRGNRLYSVQDVEAYQTRESQRQEKANAEELARAIDDVRSIAKTEGINATEQELKDAAEFSLVNGTDLIDGLIEIVERSAYAAHDEVVALEPQEQGDGQPAADDTGRSDQGSAGSAPPRERAAGPEAGAAPEPPARGEQSGQAEQPRGEAPVEAPTDNRQYLASKAMEDALDKIEVAVEANDRKAVMEAARDAKQLLAATPQAIKDDDLQYWSQFGQVIAKMVKPGYVTAKQQIEAEAAPPPPVTRDSGLISAPSNEDEKINTPAPPQASEPGEKIDTAPETAAAPSIALARALMKRLGAGEAITAKILQDEATKAHGGTLAEGKFDRKDAHDALELAVNLYIRDTRHLRSDSPDARMAFKMLDEFLADLPTQRVRSDEMVAFDQFSTPPNYALAAAYAANLRSGDTLLEPSAGTGSLVAASSMPGVKIVANELSDRRAALLRELVGTNGRVFKENAEQLDNVLPDDVTPTVVVMNPPFSQTAGRMGDKKVPMTPAVHIEAALKRLEPGGRVVAIVGRGMTMGSPTFRAWWGKIGEKYTVVANIGVAGGAFEKYGTTFGTRLVVIDKVQAPANHKPVLVEAQTVEDLMRALEPIRDARPSSPAPQISDAQSPPVKSSRAPSVEGRASGSTDALSASAQSGGMGTGERGGRGVAVQGSGRASTAGGQSVRVEAADRVQVAAEQSERAGQDRADGKPPQRDQPSVDAEGSRGGSAQRDLQPSGSGQSSAAAVGERVGLEQVAPGKQGASEISESLYQPYEPARVRVKGAKPHPGPLVESASMSSVSPPPATYAPHLPKAVIEKGLLSLAQLETTVYAGQAHSKMLPAGEGETAMRRGFFIGDGTGVGKGREIAGIILDNFQQGRKKAIWVSEKQTLLTDAKRDWGGLEQNANLVFNAGKVKTGEPITAATGVGFITYDTLKGGMSDQEAIARGGFVRKQKVSVNGQSGTVAKIEPGNSKRPAQITVDLDNKTRITAPANEVTAAETTTVKSRVDQLVDWVGADFDGVIAFDEAHNMGNAATTKGDRGFKDAAQKALAGIALQDRLPNARVVYVSATGATEVSNLAFANRLGLWGRGTPFASRDKFVADVEEGGIAAMELIARDMKQLGLYTARNLSYDGVEYARVEHKLDANQREIYDTLAEAWQSVLRNINAALEETGGDKDARAKSAAKSAFWGAHQRFFNQVISSMQMPSVIEDVEKDLAAGRQAVLQLTNTNEASQERAAAKATTAEQIEDLDITPRDQIIQLVERSFPTQEYETYTEEVDGKSKVRSRPVVDSNGAPVQNKQALRMKEDLIEKLASIRVPQGPLDMVLDHFGVDVVAEVTGRGRRFVLKPDEKTGERKRVEESRPGSANLAETDAFQAGKKKILIFSEAGGTGRSYHADNTSASKNARRAHYLVQGGWRADKAVQGFGRTHRTNQASAPIVKLVTTDLQGQKRFISSIARRLSQLGALTKGQRQAGDQGIFSARDNLESTEATSALRQFYTDLLHDNVKGVDIVDFEEQTGLQLRNKDDEGRSMGAKEDLPPITQFLNRLLSLKIDMQNRVFDAFSERLDRVIEARQAAGLLDVGLETVKADKIVKETEKVVHTIEDTSAETKHVKFTLSNKFVALAFDDVADNKNRPVKFFVRSPKGKVYAVAEASSLTDAKGKIVDYYRLINGVSGSHVVERANVDTGKGWDRIDRRQAETMWKAEIDKAPEFISYPMHLITGAILPIWDRLKGSARVVRLQTDTGEQFIGRVIPNARIADTLKALGAEADAPKVTPESLHAALSAGGRATLSNGWVLKRSRVANEQRIELTGPSSFSEGTEVKKDGAFTERIDFKVRYFVPTSLPDGPETLQRITRYRPVVELTEANARPGQMAAGDEDAMFKLRTLELRAPFTDEFTEQREKVYPLLRRELDRLGLPQIALKLPDTIEAYVNGKTVSADGHYLRGVLSIALDANRKFNTLHHEALHALRRFGLFKDGEWSILTRAANARWLNQFKISERYSAWPQDKQIEEAIAHAYAEWAEGKLTVEGRIARLFKRIGEFFEAVGNALRGAGFRTAEGIFRDIKGGEVGWRMQPRNVSTGQFAPEGAIAYAVRSSDGDLFKSEIVQTPDGPREQLVIPGAERISDRQRAEREGAKPKRSSKPQKTVDGLPLFENEPEPDLPLFALRQEPGTAIERHNAAQGFLQRGQFIDRALRMPFDVLGGTTKDGVWKPGRRMFDKAASVITRAEFSTEGRFAFLNPVMEVARTGLVDRYSLRDLPEYVDRERKRALDERAVMLQGVEALKSLKDHGVGREEAKVLQAILTGEQVAAGDMEKLSEPIRAAIDQLGQEAVALGMVSPESYERNRGTYLHRVYQKYEAEQSGLARMVNRIMGSKRKKIIGDQFKGRGLFQEVDVARLMKDVPGWNEAARGKPQKGEAFILLDEMPAQGALALNDDTSKVKPLRRIYWPAETAIPDRYDGFRNQGMWEVRDVSGGKITLWRDFTKEERTKMGEILDARYTIGKTFMLMAHDLANGRFYKDIAENEGWARSTPPNAKWLDASEWAAQRQRAFKHGDVAWVKVPDVEIPNSGGKKRWGALAGKWVREEIWRDLNELQIMQTPGLWRALLTQWKLNKTARSPVVHMNNVLSNFVLMDMIDVRFQDFASGLRSYIKGDEAYQEAFANGAFGGDMMSQEVRDQVLKPILEELEKGNTYQQGGHLGALSQVSKFTESLWTKLKAVDAKMIDAYRVEDEIFRMAAYTRRRQLGDDPKQAADVAREQFIDYDVRAPWINAARNTVLPFITYTYRAAPMVARAIATRPWKLGKYFLLTYMLNALAYGLTGDDDETAEERGKREDRERKSLRENEQGRAWLGTPRMLRIPLNDRYNNPLFLDIRRWVPASDIFDTQGNDMPAWLNLGGPLMIGAELFLNRNAFTGEAIVNTKTDDVWDRMGNRGDHVYKSYMPSAAWVPNSWYWDKIENAVKGATDAQGRPYSTLGAVSNSVGIKVKPQDVEDGLRWKAYEFSKVEQELSTEAGRLARRRDRKIISESEFERAMADIGNKRRKLNEKREKLLD